MALTAKQKAALALGWYTLIELEQPQSLVQLAGAGGAGGGAPGAPGGGDVPPPAAAGQTIAQQAAAAGKLKPGTGHGPAKKVASAQGVNHYHLPLGSLIIAHGGEHFVKGEPSHVVHGNISQAKWVANQWGGKDKDGPDKAADAAEAAQDKAEAAKDKSQDAAKAVEAGTHHWVQSGQHTFAVHKALDVHVPKGTDMHDAGAVKNAPKVIVKHNPEHPEQSEHANLHPVTGLGQSLPHTATAKQVMEEHYKKLPPEVPKKAVHVQGQHAAWVPHDWQVYKSAAGEKHATGKWAKDPQGNWHLVNAQGIDDHPLPPTSPPDEWVKSGKLVPDETHKVHPDHVTPNQAAGGPEAAKVDVGGVAVTKDQIADALNILNEAKSTNVKGPLKAKGSPLWEMDYCVDQETEILTRRGWLTWRQLQAGDWALAVNPETGIAEWTEVEDVYRNWRQHRRMVFLQSNGHSSLTTSNHRWLVVDRRTRQFTWTTSESMSPHHRVPVAVPGGAASHPKYSDALVELAAWFFTEGSYSGGQAQLSQSMTQNSLYCARIEQCLRLLGGEPGPAREGFTWRYTDRATGVRLYHLTNALADELLVLMPGKVPTSGFLGALTQAQLELFIATCVDADGHRRATGETVFCQWDAARMDAFMYACVLAGQSVSVSRQDARLNRRWAYRQLISDRRSSRSEVDYVGMVWCPVLKKHHNWAARREGKVYFTGNTGIAEQELKAFPELKVESGTKKQHVGKVKLAILHHLAGKLAHLAKTEAEAHQQEQVQAGAKAAAAHAQVLTPAAKTWGGKEATAGQLAQAAQWLADTMGGKQSFKQAMTKFGNPLAGADYMGAAKAYLDAHPNTAKGWSTKKLMLESLTELQGQAEQQDAETGHPQAAALHDLLVNGKAKDGWDQSADGAVAMALVSAAQGGGPRYAFLSSHTPGLWVVKAGWAPNTGKAFMEATPDHHVIVHMPGGTAHEYDAPHVADIVAQWVKPKSAEPDLKPAAKDHPAAGPAAGKFKYEPPKFPPVTDTKPEPGTITPGVIEPGVIEPGTITGDKLVSGPVVKPPPASAVVPSKDWQAEPEWPQIHALVMQATSVAAKLPDDTDSALAKALWLTGKLGTQRWLKANEDGGWILSKFPPQEGSWAAQTIAGAYHITADHQVIHLDAQGNQAAMPPEIVLEIAQKLAVKEPEPEKPAPAGPGIPVSVSGEQKAVVPAGSKFYKSVAATTDSAKSSVYVKKPDGTWIWYGEKGTVEISSVAVHDAMAAAGQLKEVSPGSLQAEPEKPAEPPWKELVPVFLQGKHVGNVPAGSTFWYDVNSDNPKAPAYIYIKQPDGTWKAAAHGALTDSWNSAETLNAGIESGEMKPWGPAAEAVAKAAQVPAVKAEPPPDGDGGVPLEPAKDIAVHVKGKHAGDVPAGSQLYYGATAASASAANYIYVKKPDGAWAKFSPSGGAVLTSGSGELENWVTGGQLVSMTPGKAEAPAKPEETPSPPEPAQPKNPWGQGVAEAMEKQKAAAEASKPSGGEPIPVIKDGIVIGTVPAGSTLYAATEGGPVSKVKKPDGSWALVGSSSISDAHGSSYDVSVTNGTLQEVAPPTGEQLAHVVAVGQLKDLLKTGAVSPKKVKEESAGWQAYAAFQLASKSPSYFYGALDVYYNISGGWSAGQPYGTSNEYWSVDPKTFEAVHHKPDGTTEPVPFAQVKDAIEQHVQPSSVLLGGKVYKHGFYYNPKGKAYLEIKPSAGSAYYAYAKAKYIWHQVNGHAKEVTYQFASTQLEKNTEFHTEPKTFAPAAAGIVLPAHATAAVPGTYHLWASTAGASPVSDSTVTAYADGSGTYYDAKSGVSSSLADTYAFLLGGSLLDQYGNTVVKPGVTPEAYHVFGSGFKDKAELEALKTQLEQATDGGAGWTQLVFDFFGGKDQWLAKKDLSQAFFNDKLGSVTGSGQRQAIIALLKDLLAVPAAASIGTGGTEPKFLKSLPAGISSAKDVFSWTGQGHATPYSGTWAASVWAMTATEMADKIKAVSAEFGGGQVVGTHLSGLTKDEKAAWLEHWKKGNMAAVFNLDAKAGKVSPAHPGAPENTATHQVTWAPWDPAQVPAGQGIEGTWSSLDVQPTKAETANYLIKAGLQHAAYLTLAQRRQWVKAHRQHDQDTVDTLSKLAHDRFSEGHEALSEPPAWTDDVQPAKTWTVFLEDATPAAQWTYQARDDFIAAHKELLLPFAQQIAAAEGYGTAEDVLAASYARAPLIQKYLDDKAAKDLAEKLRPRYELVKADPGEPARATDQFGHQFWWHAGTDAEMARRVGVYHLARAWGFKAPKAQLAKLEADGTPGVITDMVTPTDGTLAHLPGGIGSLSGKELADLAREHLFDHVIGNPSSTPGEYVRVAGAVTGTGKDAAFTAFLTWSGLDQPTMNQATVQPVHLLLKGITDGQVSKDQADAAYAAAVRAARRMGKLPEQRLAAILNDAGLPMNTQLEVFQRVNSLASDAQKFWDQVFASQGWTPPEVPDNKLPLGLYSGFSEPGLVDHVMAAKAAGVPAFFAGPHLEDAHFLVWTEKAGDNRYLRGESSIRGGALDKVIAWAEAHQTGSEAKPEEAMPKDVQGVSSWHAAILAAAKAVSRHAQDQMWEGPVTKAALQALADLKTELTDLAQQAGQYDESSTGPGFVAWVGAHGYPYMVAHAAQYYLDQVAKVEHAKASALTFKPGDIAEWTAPEPPKKDEKPKPLHAIKVEYLKATRVLAKAQSSPTSGPAGDIHGPDGELQLGSAIYEYPGYAWHITLPTGEVIEVNDKAKTSSPKGHQGRVRFRAIAEDGATSLERIREQLQAMGVPLEEAAPEDMELFYWRHLAHVLADRADRQEGKHAQVWATLDSAVPAAAQVSGEGTKVQKVIDAGLDPVAELAIWHQAWAHLTSPQQVQEWADKGRHLPHLPHLNTANPEVPAGKPYWYRFDADPAFIAGQQLPGHSLGSGGDIPYWVATTGGLYSTEGRLRAGGVWVEGSSSSTDMVTHGSSGVVYTRQNQESSTHGVYISPRVLARTSVYGFNHDGWGDLAKRQSSSHFNLKKLVTQDTYETNIKDAIPLLDDIMLLRASSSMNRDKIIAALKARGIHEIRGLKVEDRIVTSMTSAVIAKAKAAEPDPSTWFDHPAEPWTPPHVTWKPGEKSIVESQAEKEHAATATPAEEVAKAQALAVHDQGAPVGKVSQVFYHAAAKPPQDQVHAVKAQVKSDAAQRITGAMKSSTGDITALAAAAGLNVPAEWGPARQATVGAFVAVWAQSNTSLMARAMQQVAHQLFGLGKDFAIKLSPEAQAEVDALIASYGAVIEDFLLTQYNLTQEDLAKHGITHLTLYRGFNWASGSGPWGTQVFGNGTPDWAKGVKAGDVIDTPAAKPFSSWAFEFPKGSNAMAEFTGHGPYTIVKATVPAALVMSYPRSGMGSYWQYEFLVLDSQGKWEVWDTGG